MFAGGDAMKVLVLNGPNLDLLGEREVALYGARTLESIEAGLIEFGAQHGLEVFCRQSNLEGELIEAVHWARANCQGLVIHPGGYSHTSVALRDALAAFDGAVIEVHLTNVAAREPFRRHSLTATAARGVISGLGPLGYRLALQALLPQEDGDGR